MRVFEVGDMSKPNAMEQASIDAVGLSKADLEMLRSVAGATQYVNKTLIAFHKKIRSLPLAEYIEICEADLEDLQSDSTEDVAGREAALTMIKIFREALKLNDELTLFGLSMLEDLNEISSRIEQV
jgi:hypothetical protein